MSEKGTVLVTGGSGYIAGWLIVDLLERGYSIKTTIRNLAREAEVRATLSKHTSLDDRLTFIAADLQSDANWETAAQGCDYVWHVASPMPIGEHAKADLVKSAREGTRRVLNAALKANARRVVVTSSIAASSPNPTSDTAVAVDESVWTDVNLSTTTDYAKSKTLAEKDSWQFAEENRGRIEIATVLPSVVLGPVLGQDNSGSLEIVSRLLGGKIPAVPNLGFSVVDVRDLVDLHRNAMFTPEAAGQRFIASHGYMWMKEMALNMKEQFGMRASKVPTITMPDFVLHLMAMFQPEYKQVTPNLGKRRDYSCAKAKEMLAWTPRSARETVLDCAQSLLDHDLV